MAVACTVHSLRNDAKLVVMDERRTDTMEGEVVSASGRRSVLGVLGGMAIDG